MPRLIDADKLKDIISDTWILDRINEQPTVDAEPVRHGHWIRDFSITEDTFYECSVCGRQECLMEKYDPKEEMPYCHCGAKMDEVTDETD